MVSAVALANQVEHPREDYRIRPDSVEVEVVRRQKGDLPQDAARVIERLHGARAVARIGVEAGPREQMLGGVKDVALGPADLIYVLDDEFMELRAYSSTTGDFVARISGPGQGPGEFASPLSLAVDWSRKLLYVGDASRKLHVFDITQPGGAEKFPYRQSVPVDVLPKDLCLVEDRLVVHGMKLESRTITDHRNVGASILHLLYGERLEKSFGSVYEAPNPIINRQVYDGAITCSAGAQRIVHAPEIVLGEVWGYDLRGNALWIAELEDFVPRKLESLPSGATMFGPPFSNLNEIESVVLVAPDHVLVQEATMRVDDLGVRREEIHSYLLEMETGSAAYVGSDLPWIRTAHRGTYASVRDEPYPHIVVWKQRDPRPFP